jgi:hypothetical protein
MDITIYLPDETGRWAKEHELPLSRMLRDAVDAERRRREALDKTKGEAETFELAAREANSYGGFDEFTARLHGTLVGRQSLGIHGSVDVYQGEDGKLYVHDYDGQLHRDVDPEDLSDHLNEATYLQAMRTLGEEPVIDIGMAE